MKGDNVQIAQLTCTAVKVVKAKGRFGIMPQKQFPIFRKEAFAFIFCQDERRAYVLDVGTCQTLWR
ncbi:MAG: hypothetical protein JZU63_11715, partial [Rhodoferax sp.]|nr:hypothetical protein [Rhodoferax sp.]